MIIGVGIDIADIGRFRRLISRAGFWPHWYTAAEIQSCTLHQHPAYAAAVRFAIKEATIKALGVATEGPVRWRDIEVLEQVPVTVGLHGDMAAVADGLGGIGFQVTTCRQHDRVLAAVIASSTAPGRGPRGGYSRNSLRRDDLGNR